MQHAAIAPEVVAELGDELVMALIVAQRRLVKATVESGRLVREVVRARDRRLERRAKEAHG